MTLKTKALSKYGNWRCLCILNKWNIALKCCEAFYYGRDLTDFCKDTTIFWSKAQNYSKAKNIIFPIIKEYKHFFAGLHAYFIIVTIIS